jgi:hypothetical protein
VYPGKILLAAEERGGTQITTDFSFYRRSSAFICGQNLFSVPELSSIRIAIEELLVIWLASDGSEWTGWNGFHYKAPVSLATASKASKTAAPGPRFQCHTPRQSTFSRERLLLQDGPLPCSPTRECGRGSVTRRGMVR